MPPVLSLLICSVLVFFLLRIDARSDRAASIASWIPLIWVLIVCSRMVSLWFVAPQFGDTYATMEEGSPVDRYIFASLEVVGLFIIVKRRLSISEFIRVNPVLAVLYLYCAISIGWSDFPFIAAKRFVKALGNIIMILVVCSEPNPFATFRAIIRRSACVLIPLSIVLIKYYPSLGRSYHRFSGELTVTGVTTNKNSLGLLCVIVGLFFVWDLIYGRKRLPRMRQSPEVFSVLLLLGMTVWLLYNAQSSTANYCFCFGTIVMLIARKRGGNSPEKLFRYIAVSAFIIVPFLFFYGSTAVKGIVAMASHSETFLGRMSLWSDLVGMSTASPLLGNGYDSFWLGPRLDHLWEENWWHPTEAHNGYVEVFLELGIIGLIGYVSLFYKTLSRVTETLENDLDYGVLRGSYYLTALLYNISESGIKGLHPMWLIFLFVTIGTPKAKGFWRSEGVGLETRSLRSSITAKNLL